jgi:hypothetical protein
MPDGRVLIAFGNGPLDPSPTWTRVDDDASGFVSEMTITTGKQDEFDETETNKASVKFNDRLGILDPNNATSPYFGDLHGKQILLQLYNPVEAAWFSRFRGIIDQYSYSMNPATSGGVSVVANVEVQAVGVFEYLAGLELIPGVHGNPPPVGSESTVFYEDGEVDDRIKAILADAGIDSTRYVVFSGNVNVQETKYDPGDSALVALRDAADAEAPAALANIYEDRFGRFAFHGRGSRLDPDGVSGVAGDAAWDFQRYLLGDGAAIVADADTAQIRPPVQYGIARRRIVNSALITPRGVDRTNIPALIVSNPTSQTNYGVHGYSYSDSINDGHKTNGDTAEEDCGRSAQFLVDNFANPQLRIDAATVKSLAPTDARADPTWNILSRCDISDIVTITVGYPDGEGIAEESFIEGWTQTIRPLNPTYDMVELSVNVSPVPIDGTAYDD